MLLMVMGLADVRKCGTGDNAPLSGKSLHILDFQNFVFLLRKVAAHRVGDGVKRYITFNFIWIDSDLKYCLECTKLYILAKFDVDKKRLLVARFHHPDQMSQSLQSHSVVS